MNGLVFLRYALRGDSTDGRTAYRALLLVLFLFSAFRFQVGCDWSGYYINYIDARYLDYGEALERSEPLWWLLMTAMNRWGWIYPLANVVTSAIFFAGVHVLARRQPDPLGFLVLLFPVLIVNMPMSGVRQGAAIGLLCVAFVAFIDHRPVRFALLVILASTIHASAGVFILLAPLATGRMTTLRLIITALLAIPGTILLLGTDETEEAIAEYVNSGIDAAGAAFRVGVLALSGLFFFVFLRPGWRRTSPGDYGLVLLGAVAMVGLLVLLPASTVISDRLGYYFIPIQALMFARIPYLPVGSQGRWLAAAPYLGLAALFAVWATYSGLFQSCYLPYQSWLLGLPVNARMLRM